MPALPPLLASSLSGRARRRAAAVGLALGVLMVVLGWRAQGDAPPPAEDRHLSLTPAAPYLLVDPSAPTRVTSSRPSGRRSSSW